MEITSFTSRCGLRSCSLDSSSTPSTSTLRLTGSIPAMLLQASGTPLTMPTMLRAEFSNSSSATSLLRRNKAAWPLLTQPPAQSLDQTPRSRMSAHQMGGVEGNISIAYGKRRQSSIVMTRMLDPDCGPNWTRNSISEKRAF